LSKEIQFSAQEKDKNSMFSSKSTSSISMRWRWFCAESFPTLWHVAVASFFFFNQKKNYCRHLHNCWTEYLCVTFCKRSLVPSYSIGCGGGLNSVVKSATSAIIFSLFFFMLCGLSPSSPRPVTR
jgi:hypothetical protein